MSIRFIRTLVLGLVVLAMSAAAFAQVGLMITIAPPPLPVYEQPICPEEGYIWTPGFWAYDSDIDDYYWVPGTWVLAPEIGFLWTPPYWAWGGDRFVFYDGYWGPLVGFYGGINYGFGYFGIGFEGGRWDNGRFLYNRAVSNVDVTIIHNVYVSNVQNNRTENRISYNGGEGGINARPTPQEEAAARARHLPPAPVQAQHMQEARTNPQQRASVNRGKPEIAATPKPGAFKERGVVQAKAPGGPYNPPANRGGRGGNQGAESRAGGKPENNPGTRPENNAGTRAGSNAAGSTTYNHVRELPPPERTTPTSTGNAKQDQKYQQQQEKLYAQQQKERQKIAQQQEKEDQRVARQNNEQAKQQTEQRHQQQTQQLLQRHQQQQQQIQQRQAPRQQPEPSRKPPK